MGGERDAERERSLTEAIDTMAALARIVTLTDQARAEVDEFQCGWIDAIMPCFDALSIDDVHELRRLLSLVLPVERPRR